MRSSLRVFKERQESHPDIVGELKHRPVQETRGVYRIVLSARISSRGWKAENHRQSEYSPKVVQVYRFTSSWRETTNPPLGRVALFGNSPSPEYRHSSKWLR